MQSVSLTRSELNYAYINIEWNYMWVEQQWGLLYFGIVSIVFPMDMFYLFVFFSAETRGKSFPS